LRKLAILASVCAFFFLAQFASAQQADIMFGGGTLLSSSNNNSSLNPSENGGAYLNIDGDVVFKKRFGLNIGTSFRASQGDYGSGTGITYRPILTNFNALYQPRLGKKLGLDLFGGIGIASSRFYVPQIVSCNIGSGCINYTSSNHFMEDLGGGIRYYVWHHFFVRPEVHYYHIQSNTDEFNSNNAVRVGASIGYTIGND
jgi:Outer membrane protein beta-barrel domain